MMSTQAGMDAVLQALRLVQVRLIVLEQYKPITTHRRGSSGTAAPPPRENGRYRSDPPWGKCWGNPVSPFPLPSSRAHNEFWNSHHNHRLQIPLCLAHRRPRRRSRGEHIGHPQRRAPRGLSSASGRARSSSLTVPLRKPAARGKTTRASPSRTRGWSD